MSRSSLAALPALALVVATTSMPAVAQAVTRGPRPSATSIPVPRIPDTAIDANIDASVTATARQMLRATMKALRQQDRQNVVILAADGNLYANHLALLNHVARGKPVAGSTRKFIDRRGHQYVAPAFDRPAAFLKYVIVQLAFEPPAGTTTSTAGRTSRSRSTLRQQRNWS